MVHLEPPPDLSSYLLFDLFISGALYDVSGSYVIPFVVSGAEVTLSGALLFVIPGLNKCFVRK